MMKLLRLPILTALLLVTVYGPAAAVDLKRPYEPVLLTGKNLPVTDLPVAELFVYAYKGGWQQIPFQIDEKDGNSFFFGTKNGILDSTDVISFLTADLGDSVGSTVWIDNAESRAHARFQISLIDTTVIPARRAYAYLYRSSTLTHVHGSYMTYTMPTGAAVPPPNRYVGNGDDAVQASSYKFKHNTNGIPVDLNILASVGGDPAIDLLDRWKVLVSGRIFLGEYIESEDSALRNPRFDVISGPIRILRRATYDLSLKNSPIPDSTSFVAIFYPFTYYINSFARNIYDYYGMEVLRETMDFNSNISGSKFYSEFTPAAGFTVDGSTSSGSVEETFNNTLSVPDFNWYLVSGNQGTIATLSWVPDVGREQELYYRDSTIPRLYDTGAPGNYGECGVTIKSIAEPPDPIVIDKDSLEVFRYFLGPNHTRGLGDSLRAIRKNPLKINVVAKSFVVPVELAAFAANVSGDVVQLNWRTQTESNNYGFEIQRANDTSPWQAIGFVKGKGTTNAAQSYSFADDDLEVGKYSYRLKQIDTNGAFEFSYTVEASIKAPEHFALQQNYPNPFNPSTEISFQVPSDHQGPVSLHIYNLIGQVIKTLVDSDLQPGFYRFTWDGSTDKGEMTGSGAFFYRLVAGDHTATKKMVKLQ